MSPVNHRKNQFRAQLKQQRLEITDAQRTIHSQAIIGNLKTVINWASVSSLHYYEPLKQLIEPDITEFIDFLKDSYPYMQLFCPRLIGSKWQMVSATGGSLPPRFDVVLVPMLGFDKQLNRIGYGGGYYDKFLATQPNARKIGVCFEIGRLDIIPAEPHDIKLDYLVTEEISQA